VVVHVIIAEAGQRALILADSQVLETNAVARQELAVVHTLGRETRQHDLRRLGRHHFGRPGGDQQAAHIDLR